MTSWPRLQQVDATLRNTSKLRLPARVLFPHDNFRTGRAGRRSRSARLFVGSMPGVVMKRKYASPCARKRLAKFWAWLVEGTGVVAAVITCWRALSRAFWKAVAVIFARR